jgi:hypothetical protein
MDVALDDADKEGNKKRAGPASASSTDSEDCGASAAPATGAPPTPTLPMTGARGGVVVRIGGAASNRPW